MPFTARRARLPPTKSGSPPRALRRLERRRVKAAGARGVIVLTVKTFGETLEAPRTATVLPWE
ncbi:hypothetical protein F0L17_19115 [Streptomyces sp. TRM43335]|uniref:Uncharacterized protein n=1 Tax=Streptomyces taklimakanensis TaxID=2569853 RepID=A0A6G2BGJ3_9ACTN|nr:hypothetical protein [Streptomyces taklimakanensis]